jgi:hypothetical protein
LQPALQAGDLALHAEALDDLGEHATDLVDGEGQDVVVVSASSSRRPTRWWRAVITTTTAPAIF